MLIDVRELKDSPEERVADFIEDLSQPNVHLQPNWQWIKATANTIKSVAHQTSTSRSQINRLMRQALAAEAAA